VVGVTRNKKGVRITDIYPFRPFIHFADDSFTVLDIDIRLYATNTRTHKGGWWENRAESE
jgi:hypothetical protein